MIQFDRRNSPAIRFSKPYVRQFAFALLAVPCAACAKKDAAPSGESAAIAPEPAAATPAPSGQPVVTEYGYGALRAGMPFAAVNDSLKGALKADPKANLAECEFVKWEGGPTGLLVMVVDNKIARVDVVDGSTVQTSIGAKIGDSEEQIQSLYPGRVTVTPHKYTDGHYLTVKAANAADSLYLIVFETDKGKVTRYRAGIKPGVEYIEGCS